jgi:hypothetical protein
MLLLLATLLLPSAALGAAVCTVDASSTGCYVDAPAARILSTGVQGTPSILSMLWFEHRHCSARGLSDEGLVPTRPTLVDVVLA